jgi:hypothetical protein
MENNQLQEKIAIWHNVLRYWPTVKEHYAKYTYPIGGYILPFLEGYLGETYGDSLKIITDVLRRAKHNLKEMPMAAYVIVQAEQIEPLFREKLQSVMETKIFSHFEHERCRRDYLGYLLTSNSEEPKEKYIQNLNQELAVIGNLITRIYKENMKALVPEYILRAIKHPSCAAKQFVIVVAIYLEASYRKTFLPEYGDTTSPVRVKPKRFVYFVQEILPEKFKKLKTGVFSGLLEFMNDVRPAYWMIE